MHKSNLPLILGKDGVSETDFLPALASALRFSFRNSSSVFFSGSLAVGLVRFGFPFFS